MFDAPEFVGNAWSAERQIFHDVDNAKVGLDRQFIGEEFVAEIGRRIEAGGHIKQKRTKFVFILLNSVRPSDSNYDRTYYAQNYNAAVLARSQSNAFLGVQFSDSTIQDSETPDMIQRINANFPRG
jgi:hypothetical protein